MTIDNFMQAYKINNRKKVINWIKTDLIPGAILQDNYVPDSARPPYTQARAKNANSIYQSIVKGSYRRHHVMPKLYEICEAEFNGYIDRLVQVGLIVRRVTDNITYYDYPYLHEPVKKFILDALNKASQGISHGITAALLESNTSC